MAAAESKPECKYGSACYRKNPQHFKDYSHPAEDLSLSGQHHDIVDKSEDVPASLPTTRKRVRRLSESGGSSQSKRNMKPLSEEGSTSGSTDKGSVISSDEDDVKANIKRKFLVQMPDDFYQFWEFCKIMKPSDPLNSLSSIHIQLVGPYHELAGLLPASSQCILHYRYYYDPPELITVLARDETSEKNVTGYHIGYYRDEPNGISDTFMVCNTSSEGCQLKHCGLNIFAAVKKEVSIALKKPDLSKDCRKELKALETSLIDKGTELGLNMKDIKPSGRKTVSVCFNGIGMNVPVDSQLDVGYRPLTMTNRELCQLLDKIVSCKNDSAKEKLQDSLQELVTFVQFANDECDYGMGLELGTDLFCHGDQQFHDLVLQILPLAYDLLGRKEYGLIIQEHLNDRNKDPLILNIDK